jgi:hypothetical protein
MHTTQQQIALAHPCRLAFETAHPRYCRVQGRYSVIVTCNSGYE